ncbi:MAG: AAA family ATPase [Novosphingobium sp.]|nr:AAA family ATPase [Novosphingobium sp.]
MLKKLTLYNFQSHKDTIVEFSPYVTCFTGLGNHGKSVIIRALQKVIRDEPDGTSFIMDSEKESSLELETDKGTIKRIVKKGNVSGNNMYIVNDTLPFSNFSKTGIPQEVKELLDISPLIIFGDLSIDLNFQNQLDLLFLTQGNGLPSIRGKVLGKIINIDEVQKAIQLGATKERQTIQAANRLEGELESKQKELESYNDVDQQEKDVLATKELMSLILEKEEKLRNIAKKKEEVKNIVSNANKEQTKINYFKKLNEISFHTLLHLQRLLKLLTEVSYLQASITFYQKVINLPSCSIDSSYAESLIKKINTIGTLSILNLQINKASTIVSTINTSIDINRLEEKSKELINLFSLINAHTYISQQISQKNNVVSQISLDYEQSHKEFENLQRELRVCPLCLKPF